MLSAFGGGTVFFFLAVFVAAPVLCCGLGTAESVVACAASGGASRSRRESRVFITRGDDPGELVVTGSGSGGSVGGVSMSARDELEKVDTSLSGSTSGSKV